MEIHAGSNMSLGCDAAVTVKGQAVTISGSKGNANCGSAQMPSAPSPSPQDVADPYGS